VIDLETELERAVGAPSTVDVDAVRKRAEGRRRTRRAVWGSSVMAIVLIAGAAAALRPSENEVRTGPADSPEATTTPPDEETSTPEMTRPPEGWVTTSLTVLHEGASMPERVTLFAWIELDAADVEADPSLAERYPAGGRWEALYQDVVVIPTGEAELIETAEEGTGVFRSEVTTTVPAAAAQLISSFDEDGILAISEQPPGDPVACNPVERPCPHMPDFEPPELSNGSPDELTPYAPD
jgi:hypothetical protein